MILTLEELLGSGVAPKTWSYVSAASVGEQPPGASSQQVKTLLRKAGIPQGWTGLGWFDLSLEIAPEVVGEPVALLLWSHRGASRLFLDGRPLAEIGLMSEQESGSLTVEPDRAPDPIFFRFDTPGRHQLQLLFANPEFARYHWAGANAGFEATLHTAGRASQIARERQRSPAGRRGLFTGVFLSFSLLHFLLFVFRRESVDNLYFALFCLFLATVAFLLVHKGLAADPRLLFWTESLMNAAALGFVLSGVMFVYRSFHERVPRFARWLLVGAVLFIPFAALWPSTTVLAVFLVMFVGLLEMARCVVLAVRNREDGARIVGVGILAINLGFGGGLLYNLGFLPGRNEFGFLVPFTSVLALIVSMSVFLARRFALTHRRLESQLERVRVLSEERIAQERREREQEVRTKVLEADIERKAQELEEARLLQLSMLPQELPAHPEIEIAAHMTTATEVGGDYYDFDVSDDGTMTIAVGDATGHGMRAGTMVTATKSLFNALGGDPDMVDTIKRSNLALKRMNFRSLNMALLLARYRDGTLKVTAAGMPQPLVYRRASGAVEAMAVGGMPLGSVRSFPYQFVEVSLESGDKVLFMSDGFPERLNPDGELLGYPETERVFASVAHLAVNPLLARLVEAGEDWAQNQPADDDITFVVLSVR